jgi:hypothetical protein
VTTESILNASLTLAAGAGGRMIAGAVTGLDFLYQAI